MPMPISIPTAMPRIAFGLIPLLLLGACASAPVPTHPVATVASAEPIETGISAYGLFLAGHAAAAHGDGASAANYYARASGLEHGDDASLLATRAFAEALLGGDVTRATALAPSDPSLDPGLLRMANLTRAVEAITTGNGRKAVAAMALAKVGPADPGVAILTPYAAALAGDVEGSITRAALSEDPVTQYQVDLAQGEFYERAHRYNEAETAYRALIGRGDQAGIASQKLGDLFERRGRFDEALQVYRAAAVRNPGNGDLALALTRGEAPHAAPRLPSLRQSAAEALVVPAAMMAVHKQAQGALIYLRLALRLDPMRDRAWLMVGDLLADLGKLDAARGAYAKPGLGSSQFVAARLKLAWNWQAAGHKDEALQVVRDTVSAVPSSREAAAALADLLQGDERYAESAKVLDGLIASQTGEIDWRLYFLRAMDFAQDGSWTDAEKDLAVAMQARPDEPELLNFLGYAWIDRGERLPEALAMVKRAVSLRPDSGAMIDSLGWGYYRIGDYTSAVSQLETAVVLEPGDPDVNDHLGDAYWRVNRKIEAGFQWQRVLTLQPSAKLRTLVEAKIASGQPDPVEPNRIARQ